MGKYFGRYLTSIVTTITEVVDKVKELITPKKEE